MIYQRLLQRVLKKKKKRKKKSNGIVGNLVGGGVAKEKGRIDVCIVTVGRDAERKHVRAINEYVSITRRKGSRGKEKIKQHE